MEAGIQVAYSMSKRGFSKEVEKRIEKLFGHTKEYKVFRQKDLVIKYNGGDTYEGSGYIEMPWWVALELVRIIKPQTTDPEDNNILPELNKI